MSDRLPDIVRPEGLGLTAEEVRRRWPSAIEYGPVSDPYWSLAELTDSVEEGDEP
jgi:hypothetical protein